MRSSRGDGGGVRRLLLVVVLVVLLVVLLLVVLLHSGGRASQQGHARACRQTSVVTYVRSHRQRHQATKGAQPTTTLVARAVADVQRKEEEQKK